LIENDLGKRDEGGVGSKLVQLRALERMVKKTLLTGTRLDRLRFSTYHCI